MKKTSKRGIKMEELEPEVQEYVIKHGWKDEEVEKLANYIKKNNLMKVIITERRVVAKDNEDNTFIINREDLKIAKNPK